MTRLQQPTWIAAAILAAALARPAQAQQPMSTPAGPVSVAEPVPQLRLQPPEGRKPRTIEGWLVKVDTTGRMLTIRTGDGRTELVRYTDETRVTGATDIAGLARQDGKDVTVTLAGTGATRVAAEVLIERDRP